MEYNSKKKIITVHENFVDKIIKYYDIIKKNAENQIEFSIDKYLKTLWALFTNFLTPRLTHE